jgi:hypothetical protein
MENINIIQIDRMKDVTFIFMYFKEDKKMRVIDERESHHLQLRKDKFFDMVMKKRSHVEEEGFLSINTANISQDVLNVFEKSVIIIYIKER